MQLAKKVNNYDATPPAHPSIGKHHFLPFMDSRFKAQDICLTQLQHTITYARALQHWAEEVDPPPQPTSLPGQECTGAPVGNGATCHFHRRGYLCDHGAVQMDRNNLAMVDEGHPPRVYEELCKKQQGPPKGIPVYDQLQRLAYCHSCAGYHKGRSAYNFTLGVYAALVNIQPQSPVPSTWVHRDWTDPTGRGTYGEWPDAGHHQCSIWRGDRLIWGHDGSHNGNLTALTSHHWRGASWYPVLCRRDCGPGAGPSGGW